tara:strand:+ start:180 stop:509 length:330 start_codon:yes stop_codon:yes gene_type:complete
MKNYLKYFNDTMYLFTRKYDVTETEMKFLLFIADEKGNFTKNIMLEEVMMSGRFYDRAFGGLVKKDYVFKWKNKTHYSNEQNKYRVTNRTKRLVDKFYNVLEGKEDIRL